MAFLNLFRTVSRWLDYACAGLCIFCLTAMVLLTGAQIVCRTFFTALHWSEEGVRYLLVWATFLGAASVYRRMGHINVTVVQDLTPPRIRTAMRAACHLLCGAFFVIAVIYGLDYAAMQSRQLSAALRIPMGRVYLAIPIGFAVMTVHVIDRLIELFAGPAENKEAAQ